MLNFTDIIYKNWKKYQAIILLLVLLFIFMIYYKIHTRNRENFDGTEIPIEIKEISAKSLTDIFFIKNFPIAPEETKMIWECKMNDGNYISFWQREPFSDDTEYCPIGQVVLTTKLQATFNDLSVGNQTGLQFLVKGGVNPVDFEKIWDNKHLADQKPLSIWKVIAPVNYSSLGDIVVDAFEKPTPESVNIKCIPTDILETNGQINNSVWKSPQPKADEPEISPDKALSIWNVGSYGFFFARDSYQKPDSRSEKVWSIKDKIIENQEYDPSEASKTLKITLKV